MQNLRLRLLSAPAHVTAGLLLLLLLSLSLSLSLSLVRPIQAGPAGKAGGIQFKSAELDATLLKLENAGKKGGRIAVALLDPGDGRLLYMYNPDYVLRRVFPPGSLSKPLAAAALLERPGFDPRRRVHCRGRFQIAAGILERRDWRTLPLNRDERGSPYLRCSLRDGHGPVDLRQALVHSCNVYFLSAASAHPELYARLRSAWHIAASTGATHLGQERASLSPEPASLSRFQRRAAVIGEGGSVRLTPLKIAQVYSALFTGSALLSPRPANPGLARAQYPRPFARAILHRISGILSRVPESGTLRGLKLPGTAGRLIAAKTGTATHFRRKYSNHGWNVIHGSIRKSPFVLVVFVENGSGGREARQVSEHILAEIH